MCLKNKHRDPDKHVYFVVWCKVYFNMIICLGSFPEKIEHTNPLPISRGWDVIWRDLFVQIELGVDIASLGIK